MWRLGVHSTKIMLGLRNDDLAIAYMDVKFSTSRGHVGEISRRPRRPTPLHPQLFGSGVLDVTFGARFSLTLASPTELMKG